jgi:hypothetical protein
MDKPWVCPVRGTSGSIAPGVTRVTPSRSSHRSDDKPPRSPAAIGDGTPGTPGRWYLGRQWAILIALAIRPIRPRVASNAITPRPTANLVGPPLLVLLGLPVVASDHTEQISHGPLTFKDGMVTRRFCQLSIYGRVSPSFNGRTDCAPAVAWPRPYPPGTESQGWGAEPFTSGGGTCGIRGGDTCGISPLGGMPDQPWVCPFSGT